MVLKNSILISTEYFQSRAPGEMSFQGLSSGEMVRLEESFQDLGLGDSQCGAPQLLCKIVPSFTKMSTLRIELPVIEVQRGTPHDLTKTVEFEQDLSLI